MEKGLSTGEKQMYTRAKKILASEFMYALDKDEDGAEEYLDGLLEERFAATAPEPPARHGGDRGRRLRAEARGRRPEGLRAAGGAGRWSSGRSTAFAAAASVRRDGGRGAAGARGTIWPGDDLEVVAGGATRAESVARRWRAVETELVASTTRRGRWSRRS